MTTSAISSCPFPPEAMAYYPVSPRVNNVRHDDAAVLDRVDPAAAESSAEHEPPPPTPEQESLF